MKILVTGASGLIGRALCSSLTTHGAQVITLKRHPTTDEWAAYWDLGNGKLHIPEDLKFDVAVNLAGENIAAKRWSAKQKQLILDSRVKGTMLLAEYFSKHQPRCFISASAVGYYGDRGDQLLDELTPKGTGFLSNVCKQWEDATSPLLAADVRVVNLRLGVVLDGGGGALAKMLLPFRLGLGGVLGSGSQYMSWVALNDVVDAILFCITNEQISGPINVTAPNPVTNREFTKTLGTVLRRPTVFPIPEFVLKFILGEMAEELLLSSTRAVPDKLLGSGYRFSAPSLYQALQEMLK